MVSFTGCGKLVAYHSRSGSARPDPLAGYWITALATLPRKLHKQRSNPEAVEEHYDHCDGIGQPIKQPVAHLRTLRRAL